MAEDQEMIDKVTIHNKISTSYKSYHVDGAYGGITPKGLISLQFFSERFPIPKSSDFSVSNGRIGERIVDSTDSKVGIIREYESGIFMDINVAKEMIVLLS